MSTTQPQGIQVHPTSQFTAECNPIVLRVNKAHTARLVFKPVIVNNQANPSASIDGNFVYEKRLSGRNWQEQTSERLSSLKSGEGYRLLLHADELLKLYNDLSNLYELHRQQGVPKRSRTFVPVEREVANFLAVAKPDLLKFFDTHHKDATDVLLKLMEWLAQSSQGPEAARRLVSTAPQRIMEMTSLLGVASLKDAVLFLQENRNESKEEFWQRELSKRSYLFHQVFSYPIVVIQEKAYVGGKGTDNAGGYIVDYLAKVKATDSVIFIEIKTPQTPLLGGLYRTGVHPVSADLSGAIAQVLRYRQTFMQEFLTLKRDQKLSTANPSCLVIAGRNAQLDTTEKKDCFELQRQRIRDVTVLTYDELFGRVEQLIHLLEKGVSNAS